MKISDYLTMSRDTMNAYNGLCRPILAKYDLPQVSFDILMFLTNNPEFTTAQEISRVRGIKKNLVSIHVDKLVQAGLLERGAVSHDRRKIALRCTGKAQPIIAAGLEMQQRFFARITADIPAADWAVYRRVTETIRENTLSLLSNNPEVLHEER